MCGGEQKNLHTAVTHTRTLADGAICSTLIIFSFLVVFCIFAADKDFHFKYGTLLNAFEGIHFICKRDLTYAHFLVSFLSSAVHFSVASFFSGDGFFFPFKSSFAAIFANSFSIFESSFLSAVVFLSSHFIYLIRAQAFVRLSLFFPENIISIHTSKYYLRYYIQHSNGSTYGRIVISFAFRIRFSFRQVFVSLFPIITFIVCILHCTQCAFSHRSTQPPIEKKNCSFVFEVHLLRSAGLCSFYHFL